MSGWVARFAAPSTTPVESTGQKTMIMRKAPRSSFLYRPSRGALAVALLVTPAVAVPAAAQQEQHAHHGHAQHDPTPPARAATDAVAVVERSEHQGRSQRVVQNGVAMELRVGDPGAVGGLVEGTEAMVRLTLSDAATGAPLTGLNPITWIDRRRDDGPTAPEQCRQKISTYAEGTLRARPSVDLNSYHVLAMTTEGTILVIDPIVGFGRTRLLTSVPLGSPTEDWALTEDGRRLLVSMPARDRVAVVDTDNWKVLDRLDVGPSPRRLVVQPVTGRIWALYADGVAAIDPATMQVSARIATGGAPSTLVFSPDGLLGFALTPSTGRITVIDTEGGRQLRELSTGAGVTDVAISPLVAALFVTHQDGTVAVVDGSTLEVAHRIETAPGAKSIAFPDLDEHGHHGHGNVPGRGRFGYVVNPVADQVHVIDALERNVIHTIDVPAGPDQVAFTASFAHLRSARSAQVRMLPLSAPTSDGTGALDLFDAGFAPPGFSTVVRNDDVFAQAPEMPDALYVVNPKEKMIYYFHYMEGMPVPAGGLTTYDYEPTAVRLVGRNMREKEPGQYAATIQVPDHGDYDVVFLLSEPRVVHCFDFTIDMDADRRTVAPDLVMQRVDEQPVLPVGEQTFRFRLVDRSTNSARGGLEDVLLVLVAPDGWSQRAVATPLDDDTYQVTLSPPGPGAYYLVFQVASLELEMGRRSPVILRVRNE
jgi:DNA-binding beta-propeller fold protein YncE